ncbi:MAG: PHP domain-containing protein [Clostridia bacterium]|nr:PHP domain-containing protein [Clostridia bacterium]
MKYKYQLHTHTAPTSKCGRTLSAELAEALRDAGYAGCVLTNHFMHGNTGMSRELPWEEFVACYERDYLECKAEGEKYGLDILFGVEEGVGGGSEILCYGLTPRMLYEHPELREYSAETWYRVMHELGVIVINAHPYRVLRTVPDPVPLPLSVVDGIEVYNHGNMPEYNENAEAFAMEHPELILTSGADTHSPDTVGYGGIMTDVRIRNEKDLCEVLRSGKYQLLKP